MLHFYDPACQHLLSDDAGVNGRKTSNYLKVLAANVKRIHPGVLVRRHNAVKDDFPPGSDKFKGLALSFSLYNPELAAGN
jgi:hypothetical protein